MRRKWLLLLLLCVSLSGGCTAVPYHFGDSIEDALTLKLRSGEQQIERGRPNAFVDGLGHYLFSLPSKLILFDWRVDNHDIPSEVEADLAAFLQANSLENVKVRLNQYAPGAEWSRLVRNREVSGFWRYTLGVLNTTFYMIFPGRVFGGDHYNPYTNTIHLYSGHSSIALHEGAHAKDIASRRYPGIYTAARLLPLAPLYQEGVATGDAVGYHRAECQPAGEKADYKILYPAYGTYVAGEALNWISTSYPIQLAIQATAAIPGHAVGRIRAALVDENPDCMMMKPKEN
ncbi:MAG: hypothetical protein C0624_03660 [Desulfuromonas sp.]|nr:MAG: hypothetical protein C0624_03660 [Desulfuromonas sp.]